MLTLEMRDSHGNHWFHPHYVAEGGPLSDAMVRRALDGMCGGRRPLFRRERMKLPVYHPGGRVTYKYQVMYCRVVNWLRVYQAGWAVGVRADGQKGMDKNSP